MVLHATASALARLRYTLSKTRLAVWREPLVKISTAFIKPICDCLSFMYLYRESGMYLHVFYPRSPRSQSCFLPSHRPWP